MSRSQGSPPRADLVRDPFPNAQPEGSGAELISAQRAAAVLLAVAQALTGWGSYERASERLLRDLAGALGLSAGALWLRSGDSLVAGAIWCPDDSERAALHSALGPLRLARGASLPCCAWERREPINRPVARGGGFDAQQRRGSSAELRSQVALPACDGEEVLAVIELYGAANTELCPRVMHVLRVAGHLLGMLFARRRGELRLSPLTSRELEVLTLAAEGLTGRRIAERLHISPATVKTHFEHVFRKLGVRDRTAAVAQALRGGLIA